jgi:hypothetical protein
MDTASYLSVRFTTSICAIHNIMSISQIFHRSFNSDLKLERDFTTRCSVCTAVITGVGKLEISHQNALALVQLYDFKPVAPLVCRSPSPSHLADVTAEREA